VVGKKDCAYTLRTRRRRRRRRRRSSRTATGRSYARTSFSVKDTLDGKSLLIGGPKFEFEALLPSHWSKKGIVFA
jgi:predicted alpha/beta-hydrolase family hydrolase